jgi:hypothetical protein
MDSELDDELTNTKKPAISFHRDGGFCRFRSHRIHLQRMVIEHAVDNRRRIVPPPQSPLPPPALRRKTDLGLIYLCYYRRIAAGSNLTPGGIRR